MKISMIVLNDFTHDARVKKEAESLSGIGNQVIVNALWKPGLAEEEYQSGFKISRFRQRVREFRYVPGLAWIELLLAFTWRVLRQTPDVVHAHDLKGLILGFPIAIWRKASLIYDSHELESERNVSGNKPANWKRNLLIAFERFLIQHVDAVITVSPSIARHLSEQYNIQEPYIIHNCPPLLVDLPEGKLREKLKLSPNKPIILYQGALLIGRGLPKLLEAMTHLPGISLAILGKGPMLEEMEEFSVQLGVQDRIFFLGEIPYHDLLHYTCDADVGTCLIENVCLSYYYALPNKLFEYMMAGIPVLASDFPDLQQIVIGSNVGVVTDASDSMRIAQMIRKMLDHRDELEIMRVNARQLAISRYNWQTEEKILFQIYSQVLGKKYENRPSYTE